MLSLLSPIAMSSAGADMWQGGVRWSALGAGQHPLGKVMGMLAVDTVVYFVLALYFERAIGEEAWDLCFCLPESVRRVLRLRALSAQDATDHVPLLNVSSDDDFAPEGARVVEGRSAGRGEAVGLCGDEEMGISALGGSGRGLGGSQECGVLIRSVRKVFDGTCAQDESVHGSTTVAIDGVTLDLLPGQIVALLGPNGAGKSTLINLLTGKLLPSAGHISVFGRRVDCTWDLQKIHENLGYCPQDDILLEDLTVREHLQLFAGLKGRGNEEVRLRSHELDLASVLDKQVKTLSGGFKRRLSVALALTGDPRLVILDEPSSGMDTTSRRALWAALKQNRADRVLLVSTHSMEEADAMADRLAILVHGTLKACGEPMALKSKFGLGYRLHCVRSPPAHSAPDEGGATAAALASSHQRGRAGGGMAAGLEKLEGWVKQHVAEAKVVATSASEVTFELGLPDALPVKGTSSHAAAGGADDAQQRQRSVEAGRSGGGGAGQHVGGEAGGSRKSKLAAMLRGLDASLDTNSLGISTYGLTCTSLEDVFLQICEGVIELNDPLHAGKDASVPRAEGDGCIGDGACGSGGGGGGDGDSRFASAGGRGGGEEDGTPQAGQHAMFFSGLASTRALVRKQGLLRLRGTPLNLPHTHSLTHTHTHTHTHTPLHALASVCSKYCHLCNAHTQSNMIPLHTSEATPCVTPRRVKNAV